MKFLLLYDKKIGEDGKAEKDETICISCGTCRAVCPVEAPEEV